YTTLFRSDDGGAADGGIGAEGVDLGVVEERRQAADVILPGAGGVGIHGQQAIDIGTVHQRQKLYRLKTNDVVGVRGPYGNGYPMQEIMGNDVLLAAGGLGMAPLRSLLWYALDHRDR